MKRKKSRKWIWLGGLFLVLLVMAIGAAPDSDGGSAESTASTAPPTTAAATTSTTSTSSSSTVPTADTEPPATSAAPLSSADGQLAKLTISAETHDDTYDRTLFPHWLDLDRDGCDTRCEVLTAEKLAGGGWMSTYDGTLVHDASDIDIDHLVPLAEAWRSGAWAWATPKRASFANDLDEPAALAAVSASSNRSKGDGDPASWRPQVSEWCTYARAWIRVKVRWELTADKGEVHALREMLQTC